MSLQTEMEADFAAILAATGEFGITVTWDGQTKPAIQGENFFTEPLGLGGFTGDANFSVTVLKSAFTTPPVRADIRHTTKSKLTIGGVEYRILAIRTSEDDPTATFDCEGKDK